jgi:antitoxin HicB
LELPPPANRLDSNRKAQKASAVTHRKPRVGSDFEDFLREDGLLEGATEIAIKRVFAWEIQRAMQVAGLSRAEMARRMKTSRAVVRRLLDDKDPAVTLATISRAALALGKHVELRLAA